MSLVAEDTASTVFQRRSRNDRNRLHIRIWLGVVLLAIFALVLVGGATRLTDSGLSITQWKPIHGIVPPLNATEWEEEFSLYQQIPEYQIINKDMDLDGFKRIFWWEWAHRFLARAVGVLFAVPFVFFLVTGRVEKRLRWPLFGLFVLGGLQGAVGWWMVASGLVERVDVSQYRLATHLTLACIIFAAILWVQRGLSAHTSDRPPTRFSAMVAGLILFMAIVQIYLGGLVAGLDAGLSYNTWPLMDGQFLPTDVFAIEPAWRNLFENPKLVQLDHRLFGYLLWFATLAHMVVALVRAPQTTHARRAIILFALVSLQAVIGILTLVMQVPFDLALTHQGGALIVLGFATAHFRGFFGEYPRETKIVVSR